MPKLEGLLQSQLSRRYKGPPFFFHSFYLLLCLPLYYNPANSLSPDGWTLLQVKKVIQSDPCKLLADWKEDDLHPCSWTGVTCDNKTKRVVSINITGNPFCGERASIDKSDEYCSFSSLFPIMELNFSSIYLPVPCSNHVKIPCTLNGYLSPAIGNLSQLRTLSISFQGFQGKLPREIATLAFLEVLELPGNYFSGSLPPEFSKLSNLKVLNLAYNSLEGEIPNTFSGFHKIRTLNLAGNMLTGRIPSFLECFTELEMLLLSFNRFNGTIPTMGARNCMNMKHLHLSGNLLTGKIPPEIGNCSVLQSLLLSSNFLTGPIPSELGRLLRLQLLDVSRNHLGGNIPTELGNCSQLSVLVLTNVITTEPRTNCSTIDLLDGSTNMEKGEYNLFSGTFPDALSSLPKIRILWAPRAFLSGPLPSDWGNCEALQVLNLGGNMFIGRIPLELGNCRNLVYLDLSSNNLEGQLLEDLQISCMVLFNISGNKISGNLSLGHSASCLAAPSFNFSLLYFLSKGDNENLLCFFTLYCGSVRCNMPVWLAPESMLIVHDLSNNNLTGPPPSPFLGVGLAEKLPAYHLFLSHNKFSCPTPTLFNICQDVQSFAVYLNNNLFNGTLPVAGLLSCDSLRSFVVASNNLTGFFPEGLGNLRHLVYLDLGMNNFTGRIPPQMGQLKELKYLILANNKLVGDIPIELGWLSSLLVLDLSGNALLGGVPESLAQLSQLNILMLNNNSLTTGGIPDSFTNFSSPTVVSFVFNNLLKNSPTIQQLQSVYSGEGFNASENIKPGYATSAASAQSIRLQESSPSFAATSESKVIYVDSNNHQTLIFIVAITCGCAIVAVLVTLGFLFHCTRRRKPNQTAQRSGKKEVVTFGNINPHLSYENIARATGNFSVDNLIGTGGFGATYKAEILPGLLVAVKRLSLGRFQGVKQFDAEIHTVGRIRHPNLVTLIGYHASESEMFLIYNYLPGGNLESLIHNSDRETITWKVRYKIALDIAQALAYLHDECTPKVLHRDIKPSNILLDNKLNAYVSDFGLARLLSASETHVTTDVAGTFGYVAPEYAMTCRVSDKADVYSFGVVLLELLSGKRALDPSFSLCGNGFNIVAWAYQQLHKGQGKEVFASGLWEEGPHSELIDALKLAITCTLDSLSARPTMKQVVVKLKSLQLSSPSQLVVSSFLPQLLANPVL